MALMSLLVVLAACAEGLNVNYARARPVVPPTATSVTGTAFASTAKAVALPAPAEPSSWYRQLSETHYLPLACAQSCLLRSSSDVVGQLMQHHDVNVAHAAAMGTIGLFISGIVGASWLKHLEGSLGSGTAPSDVAKKAAADFLCYAPFANSCYLFFVPLLTALYSSGMDPVSAPGLTASAAAASFASLQHSFGDAMQLELSMFAPYNVLSFKLIPAAYRPQTTAAMCAGFTVMLSGLC